MEYYRIASALSGVRHGERDLSGIDPDLRVRSRAVRQSRKAYAVSPREAGTMRVHIRGNPEPNRRGWWRQARSLQSSRRASSLDWPPTHLSHCATRRWLRGLPVPKTLFLPGSWSTGSGKHTSERVWSRLRATSALTAVRRHTPSCSIGSPASWSRKALVSSRCTG